MESYEYYLEKIRDRVGEKRYNHTLGVVEEAELYARIHGADIEKAKIAAALHDSAKYVDISEQRRIIKESLGMDTINTPDPILHGITASILVREEFGIDDADILNAIRYHTTGRPNMSLLEKVIYVADFTDPGRNSYMAPKIHKIAIKDITRAVYESMSFVVTSLEKNGRQVDDESRKALDYYGEIYERITR